MPSLCPVKALDYYLKMTEPWREQNQENALFLCHINPHKKASKPTLTRWIKGKKVKIIYLPVKAARDTSLAKLIKGRPPTFLHYAKNSEVGRINRK